MPTLEEVPTSRSDKTKLSWSNALKHPFIKPFEICLLLALLLIATLAFWLYSFTDWWSAAAAVGGFAVAVVTFIWKLPGVLFSKRQTRKLKAPLRWARFQLQMPSASQGFSRVFNRINRIFVFVNLLLASALGATFLVGTLVVEKHSGPEPVELIGNGRSPEILVAEKKYLLWASWLHVNTLRADDLPENEPAILPWASTPIKVPDFFLRDPRVLVIAAGPFGCSSDAPCQVTIRDKGDPGHQNPFSLKVPTSAFWLGCRLGAKIQVPVKTRAGVGDLLPPAAPVCQGAVGLTAGHTVGISVASHDGSTQGCVEYPSPGLPNQTDELALVYPDNQCTN